MNSDPASTDSSATELERVERTVRNLAFLVERNERLRSERLDEIAGRAEAPGGGGGPPSSDQRRPAGGGAGIEPQATQEIRALRRQVTELQRSVAELRRGERPGRPRRARGPWRVRVRRAGRLAKAWIRERFFKRRIGRLVHHGPRELRIPRRYRRPIELAEPPSISIVTPSYNQGRFLERTVRSVLDQEYPGLEYIVQDGGSDDDSVGILERVSGELHHWESGPDGGQGDAINRGFARSSGELMAYLNSDDLLLPGSLAYVARFMQRHPEVDLVYGHRVLVDEDDREIGRWILPRHDDEILSWADFVPQETMVWRRSLWERSGARMDPEWKVALDWDLLLRFRDAGARAVRLPRFLGCFRVHDAQKTTAWKDEHLTAEMRKLRKRSLGHEPAPQELRRGIRPYMRRHHALRKLYSARLVRY